MRVARTTLLALLPALACSASSNAPAPSDGGLQAMTFPNKSIRDVDVLFVVDDAPGTAPALARLPGAFAAFFDALAATPAGTPSLHVALVSADMGAGAVAISGCLQGGDGGMFASTPRGACASLGLPRGGARYFSVEGGATNFDPSLSLADALACVAPQTDSGCRFPQPLAAALRALGADDLLVTPEDAGFLRNDAFLAIVVVTNQDDCSVPRDAVLFDPASRYVADPLGPLTTFRCAEFGLSCGGAPPPRTRAGAVTGCQSAEDGELLRVSDAVARLERLKIDPNMILVAAVSGPTDPFAVELDAPGLAEDPSPWPALSPSCASADGVMSARPGVRLEQWVYAFGHNGTLASTCDDLATSLRTVAASISDVLGPPCLPRAIAKKAGPHGARPDCTIVDYGISTAAGPGLEVPSCVDTAGDQPCWTLSDAAACPGGQLLQFDVPAGVPSSHSIVTESAVSCVVCDDPDDLRCR